MFAQLLSSKSGKFLVHSLVVATTLLGMSILLLPKASGPGASTLAEAIRR
jgi:hypothetical protein